MIFKYFFIFWFVLFFGGIGFIVWIIYYIIKKRKSRTPKVVFKALEKKLKKYRKPLQQHDGHDISFLSIDESRYFGFNGISSERSSGTIVDTFQKPFLYYVFEDPAITESKFQLLAKTANAKYYIRYYRGSMIFKANDKILGFHQFHSGLFFNKDKQVIGQINRNIGEPPSINPKYGYFDFDIHRQINDFPIAFISGTKVILTNRVDRTSKLAIQIIDGEPSQLEADILMALAIQYISCVFEGNNFNIEKKREESSDWFDIDFDFDLDIF